MWTKLQLTINSQQIDERICMTIEKYEKEEKLYAFVPEFFWSIGQVLQLFYFC